MDRVLRSLESHKTWAAFAVAASLHGIVFAWMAMQEPGRATISAPEPIIITLVTDIVLPEPEAEVIEETPGPVEQQEPEPVEAQQPFPATPEPVQTESAQAPLSNVTSLIESPDVSETVVAAPSGEVQTTDQPPSNLAQAAEALRRLECAKLSYERREDCPPPDPFAAADAQQRLREQAQETQFSALDPNAYGPKTSIEKWAAKNDDFAPVSLFGEDNSIFLDTMAPGAYNAQRIRNGERPIWDKDIENALRNACGRD
ncbi:MAG: hypothetical protein AAGI14_12415 [Pseudomonadota bacterium]